MIAEVAAYFPGMVGGDVPWPLFRALHARAPMFEARAQLRALLGTGGGIGAAFGGDSFSGEELFRRAYPLKDGGIGGMIENLASRKREEVPDE